MLSLLRHVWKTNFFQHPKEASNQEFVSVTLLGDTVPILDMRFSEFFLNKDSLIYVALISALLTAIATTSGDLRSSFFLNAVTWTMVCTLFFVLSFIVTKTFTIAAPRLGLSRLLVPLSCIPNVHILHIFKQFLDSVFQPNSVAFFTYDIKEVAYIYVTVQVANIIFVKYDVADLKKNRATALKANALLSLAPEARDFTDERDQFSNEALISEKHFWIDKVLIQASDVLSATAQEHYLCIKTPTGEIQVRGKIQLIEEQLGNLGMRVHRSHWVSRLHVSSLRREGRKLTIVLKDGLSVPLAASRRMEFERWLR